MPKSSNKIKNLDALLSKPNEYYRIGLALSGGGYRASLFHLGVIRRLEELGIMQDISVISCVSGGSIIGAFYMVEMEERLRTRRNEIEKIWAKADGKELDRKVQNQTRLEIAKIRLEVFEEIAEKFFVAMDKNMRMRATLFAPIFHPIKGIQALVSKNYTRAELIQLEYDKHFFYNGVVDFLPSYHVITNKEYQDRISDQKKYHPGHGYHVYKTDEEVKIQLGTKVIINTISLLDGRHRSFYRVPIWGFTEMTETNQNTEKLSKVVGASSAVPGVFPPAVISGDVLTDGGVSDNQGLHIFIGEHQKEEELVNAMELFEECNVLLVSDASGQMLKEDQIKRSEIPVLARMQNIQSFELRSKNIDALIKWRRESEEETDKKKGEKKEQGKIKVKRYFAFVQLYRSLKDREKFVGQNRVPSEYIAALGGIRTDLDQFSHIEREALMYHGYTLIDSQMKEWCKDVLEAREIECDVNTKDLNKRLENNGCVDSVQKLRKPPLFRETNLKHWNKKWDIRKRQRKYREKIKNHLEVGKSLSLTQRLIKDHLAAVVFYYLLILALWGGVVFSSFSYGSNILSPRLVNYFKTLLASIIPDWLRTTFTWFLGLFGLKVSDLFQSPLLDDGWNVLATLVIAGIGVYLVSGILYLIGQPISIALDKKLYRKLTGKNIRKEPRAHWDIAPKAGGVSGVMDFRVRTQRHLRWLEAIDLDKTGNVYFSDLMGKLYTYCHA